MRANPKLVENVRQALATAVCAAGILLPACESNPQITSRPGAPSYAAGARVEPDTSTHLLHLDIQLEPKSSSNSSFSGSVAMYDGIASMAVSGTENTKYMTLGVIRNYAIVGGDGSSAQLAEKGATIVLEATDRKTERLLTGHSAVFKCQPNTDFVSASVNQEKMTDAKRKERKIVEFDFCEMATPEVQATDASFAELVEAAGGKATTSHPTPSAIP